MACNPCCCLSLKDAVVTIGIWSTIYALAQLAIFGWQFSVLAQCQHVVMAQSNLQCEYYCPCVGASTARTSAIIEDRAANTLLPNYNAYGRYDVPTYYESYWQSPEERYYTWLFIIQILCLIAAFFLLFTSIMMIYGVHTWSRFLLVPWMVTMCASILTSIAYCIMWWAGDVRDYWLMLTIIEMFGVFLNVYFGDPDKRIDLNQIQKGQKIQPHRGIQRPPASQFPAVSPPGQQPPLRHTDVPPTRTIPVPPLPSPERVMPQQPPKQQFYKQKTPMERFVQEASGNYSFKRMST
uniref:MARVEL domain-containing protein n=1 Tax=Meloidogyne hapla TaxID=6305 RepID=A0A1I8BYD0_MELHA